MTVEWRTWDIDGTSVQGVCGNFGAGELGDTVTRLLVSLSIRAYQLKVDASFLGFPGPADFCMFYDPNHNHFGEHTNPGNAPMLDYLMVAHLGWQASWGQFTGSDLEITQFWYAAINVPESLQGQRILTGINPLINFNIYRNGQDDNINSVIQYVWHLRVRVLTIARS